MNTFELRPLDLADAAALTDYHRVQQAALAHGRPHFTPTDPAHLIAVLQTPSERLEQHVTGAFLDGRMVGGVLTLLPVRDNPDLAWVLTYVEPSARRRGIGAALAAAGAAVAAGRHTLTSEIEIDGRPTDEEVADHPAVAFARGLGFHVAQREVRRELRLPADPRALATLDARAAAATDYTVETFEYGRIGDADFADILHLAGLLGVDAPSGDVDFEPEVYTVEDQRRLAEARLRAGMTLLTVAARHRRGRIVAFSSQQAPAAPTAPVAQLETYVMREHRGHGLGAALKAASTRWWQEQQPHRPYILTCNAETNAHMVAINEAAGFVPIETILMMVRKITSRTTCDPISPSSATQAAMSH